jgi:hypothetical protein
MQELGRLLLVLGGVLLAVGLLLTLGGHIPFLGRLPGDIRIQRDNVSCFIPLATSLLLSILLTVLLNIIVRLGRR